MNNPPNFVRILPKSEHIPDRAYFIFIFFTLQFEKLPFDDLPVRIRNDGYGPGENMKFFLPHPLRLADFNLYEELPPGVFPLLEINISEIRWQKGLDVINAAYIAGARVAPAIFRYEGELEHPKGVAVVKVEWIPKVSKGFFTYLFCCFLFLIFHWYSLLIL